MSLLKNIFCIQMTLKLFTVLILIISSIVLYIGVKCVQAITGSSARTIIVWSVSFSIVTINAFVFGESVFFLVIGPVQSCNN